MYLDANGKLKWLYCLALATGLFPTLLAGASGWIAMAVGAGWLGGFGAFGLLPILILSIYRIVTVVKMQSALGAFITRPSVKVLRLLGISGMIIGVIGSIAILFIVPITVGLFGKMAYSGIAFFATGLGLYLIASVGLPALMLFEFSRLLGFETKLDARRNPTPAIQPARPKAA